MKIYLDTSVLSALFDKRNPERMELTNDFFSTLNQQEVFITDLTRKEIEKTPDDQLREKMKKAIGTIEVVPDTSRY